MAIKWLNSRGVIASGESETVLNSTTEQKARTWDDGTGAKRPFNSHLKPSEAIHPDRCVRVYFDYDEKRAKTIVAWVGKHPGGLMKTIHRLTKGLVLDRETDRNVRMK